MAIFKPSSSVALDAAEEVCADDVFEAADEALDSDDFGAVVLPQAVKRATLSTALVTTFRNFFIFLPHFIYKFLEPHNQLTILIMASVISFVNSGATLAAVTFTSSSLKGTSDKPAPRLEIQEIPQTFIPICLAATASQAVLMPTASPPSILIILTSAGVSKLGPLACT